MFTMIHAVKARRTRLGLRPMAAAVITLMTSLLLATAGSASAGQYAGGGAPGTAQVPLAACTYTPATGYLEVSAPAPSIFARNVTAGAGNDAQWVRYRVFLVNATTGATISSSGYSGYALAYDNRAAAFSGSNTIWNVNGNGNYRVDYRIEWMTGNYVSGWTAFRTDSYNYYMRYLPNIRIAAGTLASCWAKN